MTEATPYDKFQLHALFDEVQGYLAELRYIDTATSYLASEAADLTSVGDQLLTPLPGRRACRAGCSYGTATWSRPRTHRRRRRSRGSGRRPVN